MTIIDVLPPRAEARTPSVPVAIYGNRWCGITQQLRRALQRAGIDHQYVDLDQHPAAYDKLYALTRGRLHTPVVYIDGEWLMEPSLRQVQSVLARHGVRL